MPSTIGWLAVAVVAGALTGRLLGHWSMVTGWVHRCLQDPISRTRDSQPHRHEESIRRTS